jgi:hypothetical protein
MASVFGTVWGVWGEESVDRHRHRHTLKQSCALPVLEKVPICLSLEAALIYLGVPAPTTVAETTKK